MTNASPLPDAILDPATFPAPGQSAGLTAVEDTTMAPVGDDMLELPLALEHFSPYDIAWPWLHEDIFLQTDMNLDWFDVPQGTAEQNNGDVHEAQPEELHDTGDVPDSRRHTNALIPPDSNMRGLLAQEGTDGIDRDCSPNPREATVASLIDSASAWTKQSSETTSKHATSTAARFYTSLASLSKRVMSAFDITTDVTDHNGHTGNCLTTYLSLYFKHFWTLWPLIARYQWDTQEIQPLLYLAMVSIGAMYGGKQASTFGTMLHNQLREELIRPHFDCDITDRDMLPLGQARSLTQAAALYFGQQRAFSYAQHIGGTLVAQARRMNLFCTASRAKPVPESGSEWVYGWIRRESCKRLAFAIMRLEMYTSVLHSSRPLVSGEEMDIEMPCSRFIWHHSFSSAEALAAAIRQENFTQRSKPLFSDLLRIALDQDEKLPYLEMLDQELLLNAVQEQVWAACAARNSRGRLKSAEMVYHEYVDTGLDNVGSQAAPNPSPDITYQEGTKADHLVRSSRGMDSLTRRINEITMTLRKWQRSCSTDEVPNQVTDRSSLLSSLLIYHLSFLQLHAPIEDIHNICHLPLSTADANRLAVENVRSWSRSWRASAAAQHAIRIFDLLSSEAERDVSSRASVNFLTMIGLYHSAVLLWVHSALAKERQNNHEPDTLLSQHITQNRDTLPTMEHFVKLFNVINPAWAARSSFCAAIRRLVNKPFLFT